MKKADKKALIQSIDEEIEKYRQVNHEVVNGLRLAQTIVRKFKGGPQ